MSVLTGSYFDRISPAAGRLTCEQFVFLTTNETGRWGLGRIKTAIDWLLIPILAIYIASLIKKTKAGVIVTIAHGHFFVAAAMAGLLTSTPFILIVHDDWVSDLERSSFVLNRFAATVFRFVARKASHVFVVTPFMQEMLSTKFGVKSEVQMPAVSGSNGKEVNPEVASDTLQIVYAGSLTGATDSFDVLLRLVKDGSLAQHGIKDWKLHLYVLTTTEGAREAGWMHDRIVFHGWVDQDRLQGALANADILFLPYSFREEERYATAMAFPSKTADYLKTGKPILIFAPPYSSLVRYGREFGFAEIVDEPNQELLSERIAHIWKSSECRQRLKVNSQTAFEANHNIEKQRARFRTVVSNVWKAALPGSA